MAHHVQTSIDPPAPAGAGDIGHLLEAAAVERRNLTLPDIDAVSPMVVPGESVALARLYAAMLADAPDDGVLEAACVRAVSTSQCWLSLLVEMLTNLPFVPAVARAIVGILAARLPDHPAARFAGGRVALIKAYDAVDDGEHIRIDLGSGETSGIERTACLLGIEQPAVSFAICTIVERNRGTLWLSPERDGPLFAEGRHVLPPAILITEG